MITLTRRLPAALLALLVSGCAGATGQTTSTSPDPAPSRAATASPDASNLAATSSATPSPSASATPSKLSATAKVDCRKLKCIALTYDDGPSEYTPQLLKSFTSRKATATLFMLGNAATAHPQIVKQAHAQGFEVANHTYDHKALSDLGQAQVSDEVKRTNEVLQRLTGERPRLMRPPYAARNSRTDATVGKQGLSVIVWNNSPEDWVAGHDTAATISRLTLERSSRDSIILMHDIHPWTVQAAPAIIDGLHKQGYTLVTVSQLLGSTAPGEVYPQS